MKLGKQFNKEIEIIKKKQNRNPRAEKCNTKPKNSKEIFKSRREMQK